jgi:hypothetical protein
MAFDSSLTTTDIAKGLGGDDKGGRVLNCGQDASFFIVDPGETENVTINGTRSSGIDANRVVYGYSMYYNYPEKQYVPTVRECDSTVASCRKVIGVAAHPAAAGDPINVYTNGVVKVQMVRDPNSKSSNDEYVKLGHFIRTADGGFVQGAFTGTSYDGIANVASFVDCIIGKAYQSAGPGETFLAKLWL